MAQLQLCVSERHGTCSVCGRWFVAGPRGAIGKFCSQECRTKARHATDRAVAVKCECVMCGNAFERSRYNRSRQTCSPECRKDAIVMRQSEMVDGTCARCGEEFRRRIQKRHKETSGRYCSAWCQKRDKDVGNSRANRKAMRDRVAARLSEIAERDNWICQLCGMPIDQAIVGPHPRCASIDHKLPLSRGGTNHDDNLQLAHLGCNARKHDRV